MTACLHNTREPTEGLPLDPLPEYVCMHMAQHVSICTSHSSLESHNRHTEDRYFGFPKKIFFSLHPHSHPLPPPRLRCLVLPCPDLSCPALLSEPSLACHQSR